MYIPMVVIIVSLIVYLCYSSYKRNKILKILEDLTRSYDQVTVYLMSYFLRTCKTKKEREDAIKLCAQAVLDAAGHSVTNHSLMSTTDILSMCKVFQRSFKMREKLTTPYFEFNKEFDKELDKIQEAMIKDIHAWMGR